MNAVRTLKGKRKSSRNPVQFRGSPRSYNNNQLSGPGYRYNGAGLPNLYNNNAAYYDEENRMVYFGGVAFGYRSDSMRAWKQNAVGARTYFYYSGDEPVFETDASGNVTAVNVFSPDGLTARSSGGSWTYYVFDAQGSVVSRLDVAGHVLGGDVYDAYGKGLSAPSDPFGYNGQWGYYQDVETGLIYCQNRYYDPANGVWLTRDPIGFAGGMNIYAYVNGNPVGGIDPLGLWDLYRWMYTGDGNASDEVYNAALHQAGRTLTVWSKHFAINNGIGDLPMWAVAGPIPKPFAKKLGFRVAGEGCTSGLRLAGQRFYGTAAGAKYSSAARFLKGPRGAKISGQFVVWLWYEAGLAWLSTYQTLNDPSSIDDDNWDL